MDRLEEIRQRIESGATVRRIDAKYLLAEVDRREKGWQEALALANTNARLFDEVTARAEAAEARADAAVEDMTAVLKCDLDDICKYCKHIIECKGQNCDGYCSGAGDIDGNCPDWKWSCEDFNFGTCVKMENTPCNGCFENDCGGFEWRGKAGKEAPNE